MFKEVREIVVRQNKTEYFARKKILSSLEVTFQ